MVIGSFPGADSQITFGMINSEKPSSSTTNLQLILRNTHTCDFSPPGISSFAYPEYDSFYLQIYWVYDQLDHFPLLRWMDLLITGKLFVCGFYQILSEHIVTKWVFLSFQKFSWIHVFLRLSPATFYRTIPDITRHAPSAEKAIAFLRRALCHRRYQHPTNLRQRKIRSNSIHYLTLWLESTTSDPAAIFAIWSFLWFKFSPVLIKSYRKNVSIK